MKTMKTIFVDDEPWVLEDFKEACEDIPEIERVGEFTSGEEALDYAREHLVEFALLDIEMPGMNGIDLAKELRLLYPEIIIVFVTGHPEYLEEFINIKADYFVVKPYGKAEVEDVLARAHLLSGRLKKRIKVHTFGEFVVMVDDEPLNFHSFKAQELFALLVEKQGASLTPQEAIDRIWDGRTYEKATGSVYRVTMKRLKTLLDEAGIGDLLRTSARGKYLDTSKFDCDLYDFLNGDPAARRLFNGEYMSGYSWGEETLAMLLRLSRDEDYRETFPEII